jgi:hypothetical protein
MCQYTCFPFFFNGTPGGGHNPGRRRDKLAPTTMKDKKEVMVDSTTKPHFEP